MKCYCGSFTHKKVLSEYTLVYKGKKIVFQDIPAEICEKCNEIYFTKEVSVMIDTLIKSKESKVIKFPTPRELSPVEIKTIRKILNLSQSKLALIMGVTSSTVAFWEQGIRSPAGPARVLLRMLANMNIDKKAIIGY